jgi:L-lactate dehydrogenase complex protein LldE
MRTYPSEKPKTVYFYGTCLVDLLYPQVGVSAIKIMQHEDVEVIFPQGQSCCGQPALNSGYVNEAMQVMESQLDLFDKDIPVVIPSGSCAGTMRHDYPRLFKGHERESQARSLADRTYELTEFLTHILHIKLKDNGVPTKVAQHVSCSSRRVMQVAEEGTSLLDQLAGISLVEQQHIAECCGFGGTFAIKHDEISAAMVEDKVNAIDETGASYMVTGDCGCMMNIEGNMKQRGVNIQCMHIAEFIYRRCYADD